MIRKGDTGRGGGMIKTGSGTENNWYKEVDKDNDTEGDKEGNNPRRRKGTRTE